jgi:hypothetical protein
VNLRGFFTLGGVILIASGLLQLFVRPRGPGETGLAAILNASTIRTALFVSVGVLAILVGTGRIPLTALSF